MNWDFSNMCTFDRYRLPLKCLVGNFFVKSGKITDFFLQIFGENPEYSSANDKS